MTAYSRDELTIGYNSGKCQKGQWAENDAFLGLVVLKRPEYNLCPSSTQVHKQTNATVIANECHTFCW